MKALETYAKVFGAWEAAKLSALTGSKNFSFFMDNAKEDGAAAAMSIDEYLEKIDRADVIKKLLDAKKGDKAVTVGEYSPLKQEGMHSLYLEKHILYRYSAYDEKGFSNVKNLYKSEEEPTRGRATVVSEVASSIPDWEPSYE